MPGDSGGARAGGERNLPGLLAGQTGFLANLLSNPVLIGYMAGIAVLMIVSQLGAGGAASTWKEIPSSELRYLAPLDLFIDRRHQATGTSMLLVAFNHYSRDGRGR